MEEQVWVMNPYVYKALREANRIVVDEETGASIYDGYKVFVDSRFVGMVLMNLSDARKKEGISEKWL